jgi:predicted metal-dependent hydrolase
MDPRLLRGVDDFNAACFFTAHEVWEELWVETVGPERRLLQGLVQIAAGYAKVESGLRGGALKLLSRGVGLVSEYLPAHSGLALQPLVAAVQADIQRLQQAAESAVSLATVQAPHLHIEG